MLEKGVIPRQEPILRVGIVLPEDLQKMLTIYFQRGAGYSVTADGKEFRLTEKIAVEHIGSRLKINDNKLCDKLVIRSLDENSYVTLYPVIAGRGFHWFKQIDVKLPETLEITVCEGSLMAVNELKLETYLTCVATSEMGAACPDSLIESQTVVARSWMLANVEQKHLNLGIDVCNDDCCQRYQGFNNVTEQSRKGTDATRGMVITFDNAICDARYSKSCGGMMERFENLWEDVPLPYMQAIPDFPSGNGYEALDLSVESHAQKWILDGPQDAFCGPAVVPEKELKKYLGHVDESGEYYRWTVTVSQEVLSANLREKLDKDLVSVKNLYIAKRAASGRSLELLIDYVTQSGELLQAKVIKDYEARRLLHPKFLYSSAVVIDIEHDENGHPHRFIYHGAGWGHGAGLCQIGALGMSLKGYSTRDILLHYYPGVTYETIYE